MIETAKTETLTLTAEEKSELIRVLENFLIETHVENRRTDNTDYRAELRHEEGILKSIIAKLHQSGK